MFGKPHYLTQSRLLPNHTLYLKLIYKFIFLFFYFFSRFLKMQLCTCALNFEMIAFFHQNIVQIKFPILTSRAEILQKVLGLEYWQKSKNSFIVADKCVRVVVLKYETVAAGGASNPLRNASSMQSQTYSECLKKSVLLQINYPTQSGE